MSFTVTGLAAEDFRPLFALSDEALAEHGISRVVADAPQGYPCRISLSDARPGETLLLMNYEHQGADTPFRSRHAIFVSQEAGETARFTDELPPSLAARAFLSLRAFDAEGMMVDGILSPTPEAVPAIEALLARPETAYIHAHYPGRGCYAARIDRS